MAQDNIQCSEEPAVAPFDPTALFPNAALQRVCGKLLLAQLSDRIGLFLIVGKAGTGKSALLAKILAQSPAVDCCVGLSGQPDLSCQALLDLWSARLGVPGESCDDEARLAKLGEFLSALLERGAASALVLDDAHSLPNEVLDELSKISQWQQNGRKLVRIILAGRPELTARLDRPELSRAKQAIAFHAEMGPLREAEVAAYIEHRLHAAGYSGSDVFSADAVESIARSSAGVPRRINVLCRAAVLTANRQSRKTVSREVAELARRECAVFLQEPPCNGDFCEQGAEEAARQTCPGQNWPWSLAGEAIADKRTGMLRPLSPSSEAGPRTSRRITSFARAAAAVLVGLAVFAAVAWLYTDRFGLPDPPAFDALVVSDDQSPPTQIATENAPSGLPDAPTAGSPAESLGQPESVASVATETAGGSTASAPSPVGVAATQTLSNPADEDVWADGVIPSATSTEDVAGSQPESVVSMAAETAGGSTVSAPALAGVAATQRLPDLADEEARADGVIPSAPSSEDIAGSQAESVVSMAAETAGDGAVSTPAPAGVAAMQKTSDLADEDTRADGVIPSAPSAEDIAGSQPESLMNTTEEVAADGAVSTPAPAGVAATERRTDPADDDAGGQQGWPAALQIVTARAGPDGIVPGARSRDGAVRNARVRSVIDEAEAIVFKPLAWRLEDALPTATGIPSPVPVQATQTWPGPSVEHLMARGDELLALGDIAAARLFYELAASSGSAEAAASVGMTYDPLYLKRRGVLGAAANSEKAVEWYNKAIDGGYARAVVRLDGLTAYLKGTASRSAGRAAGGEPETSPEAESTAGRQEPEGVIETEPSVAISRQAGPPEETARGTAVEAGTEALRIQLAALKSKDEAMKEGLRLRALHGELLGDKDLAVERLDLSGGRGSMFGVQIGPFADWASAAGACTKLKAKRQDCFVVGR